MFRLFFLGFCFTARVADGRNHNARHSRLLLLDAANADQFWRTAASMRACVRAGRNMLRMLSRRFAVSAAGRTTCRLSPRFISSSAAAAASDCHVRRVTVARASTTHDDEDFCQSDSKAVVIFRALMSLNDEQISLRGRMHAFAVRNCVTSDVCILKFYNNFMILLCYRFNHYIRTPKTLTAILT